jgi:hypothetical protein
MGQLLKRPKAIYLKAHFTCPDRNGVAGNC